MEPRYSTHRDCLGLSDGRMVRRDWGRQRRLHENWTEGLVEVEEETLISDGRGEFGRREG